ncbi:MAG: histidinol dehydrogenase, partial [Rikenellaceae bacterium]
MIKIIEYPTKETLQEVLARPFSQNESAKEIAASIIERVKLGGNSEVRKITLETDRVDISMPHVTDNEFATARQRVSPQLKQAIAAAKINIETFHAAQKHKPIEVTTSEGVTCYQKSRAISRIGLYIPGGTAPLFSTVMMLAVPAQIAGCKEIILCSPPTSDGEIADEILYCAELCKVTKVYKIGGATAIAAMAYGTETIKPCYKIFGPGNRYVTAAKQLISLHTAAIDMPAGPSEVMVVCDESAKARYVAADLLSQAEHGADSQALAITTSKTMAKLIKYEVETMVKELARGELAGLSLKNSAIV